MTSLPPSKVRQSARRLWISFSFRCAARREPPTSLSYAHSAFTHQRLVFIDPSQKQLAQTLRPCNPSGCSGAPPSPVQASPLHHQYATQQQYGYGGAPSSLYSPSYHEVNAPTSMFHSNGGPAVIMGSPNNPAYYHSSSSVEKHAGVGSPIAAPGRSRSASRGGMATRRARNNSLVSGYGINADWEEMQEVEENVDDGVASEYYNSYDQHMQQRYYEPHQRLQTYPAVSPSASYSGYPQQQASHPQPQSSSFALSDPFYLATAAAATSSTSSSQTPITPISSSHGTTTSAKGTNWFAPPVGFAAYAPAGNRWSHTAAAAGAVQ